MATPAERKALLFLSGALLLGGGVRVARAVASDSASAQPALERQIAAVDSVRKGKKSKGKGRRAKKPPVNVIPAVIDMDRAGASEIESLPYIGPTLARRIVADRDSLGPFGSLQGLQRVKGIGPKLAARIDSSVSFSLHPRLSYTEASGSADRPPGWRRSRRGESTK